LLTAFRLQTAEAGAFNRRVIQFLAASEARRAAAHRAERGFATGIALAIGSLGVSGAWTIEIGRAAEILRRRKILMGFDGEWDLEPAITAAQPQDQEPTHRRRSSNEHATSARRKSRACAPELSEI
jgi:hypothetical protein